MATNSSSLPDGTDDQAGPDLDTALADAAQARKTGTMPTGQQLPTGPAELWGSDSVRTAMEYGGVAEWRKLARAVREQPRGDVATALREALEDAADPGVAELFETLLDDAVATGAAEERAEVIRELKAAITDSHLTRAEFARQLGTSQPRLSTYLNGKVVPAATTLIRARRILESALRYPRRRL